VQIEGAELVFLEDLKEQVTGRDKALSLAEAMLMPAPLLERKLGLHNIDPGDLCTLIFTSGSTGEPKGVMLSHHNILSNIDAVDQLLTLTPEDGMLGVLPFFHCFGYTATLWLPLCFAPSAVYHFNPLDAKTVGKLAEKYKLTILMTTPTFLRTWMKRCTKEQFAHIDLVVTGAEKLPLDLARQFEEKFGVVPTEGYGTTEMSPVAAVNVPPTRSHDKTQRASKLGTVGRVLPGCSAKVVHPETFEDIGLNTEGLLMIKGPNIMCGYLDQPEKTAAVVRDGWYNTGDFAKLDEEGFIEITGRQSRFSKIGGEMVPHIKVEEELIRCLEELEAELPAASTNGDAQDEEDKAELRIAVTSVPDERKGERLVVLHKPLPVSVDAILKRMGNSGLPNLWLPGADSFLQVEEIPLLGTGKLDLRGVQDVALAAFAPQESVAS
jgi:acyl-[acyl-carrier-protein]-phospholipid O-acyltransferase / long-chain-fatty-acid--[acyl-carrier-protein] ligase